MAQKIAAVQSNASRPHLHLVKDGEKAPARKCACGREIVGNYPTCGQCNLLAQAKYRGQPLFPCANNCGAMTPFAYCWHCNRDRNTSPVLEAAPVETMRVPVAKKSEPPKLIEKTVIELNDRSLEYRELNANEAIPVRLDAAEADEAEWFEAARKEREAAEIRNAETRAMLRKAYADNGLEALIARGAKIVNRLPVVVDGKEFENPHFTVRYEDLECSFHDKAAAEAISSANKQLAEKLEAAAKAKRLTEAEARKAKRAPKKDQPKPGKSSGDNGKKSNKGGKGKK